MIILRLLTDLRSWIFSESIRFSAVFHQWPWEGFLDLSRKFLVRSLRHLYSSASGADVQVFGGSGLFLS